MANPKPCTTCGSTPTPVHTEIVMGGRILDHIKLENLTVSNNGTVIIKADTPQPANNDPV